MNGEPALLLLVIAGGKTRLVPGHGPSSRPGNHSGGETLHIWILACTAALIVRMHLPVSLKGGTDIPAPYNLLYVGVLC